MILDEKLLIKIWLNNQFHSSRSGWIKSVILPYTHRSKNSNRRKKKKNSTRWVLYWIHPQWRDRNAFMFTTVIRNAMYSRTQMFSVGQLVESVRTKRFQLVGVYFFVSDKRLWRKTAFGSEWKFTIGVIRRWK